jgi:hypothetical protein
MQKILTPENRLPHQPFKTQRSYDMQCRLKKQNKDDITIQSTMVMAPVARYKQDYVLLIDRKNIILNNSNDLTVLQELALACSACLFPMHIMVSEKGEFLSIYNHDTIVERWEALKHKLPETYDGKVAYQYLNKNNTTIHNKELLYHAIKDDFFFYCYFKPLYSSYTNELDTIEEWDTADFLDIETPVKMDQKIFYDNTVSSIRVNATNMTAADTENTETISFQYTLHPQYNTITAITGSIIREQDQINITITATSETLIQHSIEVLTDRSN